MNRTTFKLGCLYTGILVFFVSLATASAPPRDIRTHSSVLVNTTNEQVLAGADLYYENCAVCHGDKAMGLAEARLVFPEDHQYCERCHKKNNPSTMPLEFMNHRNAFNIANAPALNDHESLKNGGLPLVYMFIYQQLCQDLSLVA